MSKRGWRAGESMREGAVYETGVKARVAKPLKVQTRRDGPLRVGRQRGGIHVFYVPKTHR